MVNPPLRQLIILADQKRLLWIKQNGSDARRAGIADAGTRTPRPGVRTDDVLDAIRNVPDEPQLPKVTGGQSRVTDRGTLQIHLLKQILREKLPIEEVEE